MRIYVASSWRNSLQPAVVLLLREQQHDVYDFRNPPPPGQPDGFRWSDIDGGWQSWNPKQYREALKNPIARRGYEADITALRACDACVMVLPCGRSANWEFGYAMGQGKMGVVVQLSNEEPELMYSEATIVTSSLELLEIFARRPNAPTVTDDEDALRRIRRP